MEVDNNMLIKAKELAIKYHNGQTRWNGEPYITHPVRVSNKLTENRRKIVGLLHDILEDTQCTEEVLRLEGFSDDVIDAVKILTRKKDETYFEFIFRVRGNELARSVKIHDIADNMSDLKEGSMKDKYRFAMFVLNFYDAYIPNKE